MKGDIEKRAIKANRKPIGVDEVGRGCLAGPVYASVVALDYEKIESLDEKTKGLIRDSKALSHKQRQKILPVIHEVSLEYGVGFSTAREIEQLGIVPATFLAMRRAYDKLKSPYDLLLIDGNQKHPNMPMEQMTVVGGDALCFAIAAASILAKEARDEFMRAAHEQYPVFGFADHVGYLTKAHMEAIKSHGITPLHRRNFAPIKDMVLSERELALEFS